MANYPYVVAEQRAGTQLTSTLPPDEWRDRAKVNEAVRDGLRLGPLRPAGSAEALVALIGRLLHAEE